MTMPVYHQEGHWDKQDANLNIIKFCGFGKCPNRYACISRPETLQAVFSHDKTVFFTKNSNGETIVKDRRI